MIKDLKDLLGKKIEIEENGKIVKYTVHIVISGNPKYKDKNIHDSNSPKVRAMLKVQS